MSTRRSCLIRLWCAVGFFVIGMIYGVSSAEKERPKNFLDLNGGRIGVLNGTYFDYLVNGTLDLTKLFYFDETEQLFQALTAGDIDCVVDDEPILRFHIFRNQDQGFRLLEIIEPIGYAFPMRQDDPELHALVNNALMEMQKEGVIENILNRWMNGETTKVPRLAIQGGKFLRAGVFKDAAPFGFIGEDSDVAGIEVEILETICQRLGYDLEIHPLDFDPLFDALLADEVDVIAGCIAVTEERKRIVDFTIPYYQGGVAAMVLDR